MTANAPQDEDEARRIACRGKNQCREQHRVRAAERACIDPCDLNREFDNAANTIFNTPFASMAKATIRLMQLPRNLETERIIQLTHNVVEQLEHQNPLSSLCGTPSRATASAVPQASRTPGGHCSTPDVNYQ